MTNSLPSSSISHPFSEQDKVAFARTAHGKQAVFEPNHHRGEYVVNSQPISSNKPPSAAIEGSSRFWHLAIDLGKTPLDATKLNLRTIEDLSHIALTGGSPENVELHIPACVQVLVDKTDKPRGKVKIQAYDKDEDTPRRSETARGVFYKTQVKNIQNYNCKFSFQGVGRYVCRHMAMDHLLLQENAIKECTDAGSRKHANRAAYRNAYLYGQNGTKIVTRPSDLEQQSRILHFFGKDNHVVPSGNWDDFCKIQLKDMKEELEKSNHTDKMTRHFMVLSHNHAMTLRLVAKRENGKVSYTLSFFDPNETTTDTRVVFDEIEHIGTTGSLWNNFLDDDQRKGYFGNKPLEASTLFIRAPDPCTADAITALKNNTSDRHVTYYGNVPLNHASLCQAMHANLLHVSWQTPKGQLVEVSEGTDADPSHFLSAKDPNGTPGLYWALQEGHPETVKVYTDELLVLAKVGKLEPTQIEKLLLMENSEGNTCLSIAFQGGQNETIEIYMGMLLKLAEIDKLTSADIETILLALCKMGDKEISGLFWALREGHAKAVTAYTMKLLKLAQVGKLESTQIEKLLLALCKMGNKEISGLFWALQEGHTEAIKAYMEGLLALAKAGKLESAQIGNLLLIKKGEKIPNLHYMLQNKFRGALDIYMQALQKLKQGGCIKEDQLKEIFTTLSPDPQAIPFYHPVERYRVGESARLFQEAWKKFGLN